MTWTCGKFEIYLASTRVMGIVNVTPDSFSDGGLYLRPGDAVAHARALVRDGADVTPYLEQVRAMAALAQRAGLNIDYFPTNFVTSGGRLWYIDYECNEYMDRWNFENWGICYWSRTPEFLEYLHGRQA